MKSAPRVAAIVSIVAGVILIVAGVVTYGLVKRELTDEHITVAEDADHLAGEKVEGPFTAYSQAMVIKKHALEIGKGKTYAELDRDDPTRDTVANASYLRASLFTSVVAFGVAVLVMGLGILFIVVGVGFLGILKRLGAGPEPAATPAATAPMDSGPTDPEPSLT